MNTIHRTIVGIFFRSITTCYKKFKKLNSNFEEENVIRVFNNRQIQELANSRSVDETESLMNKYVVIKKMKELPPLLFNLKPQKFLV